MAEGALQGWAQLCTRGLGLRIAMIGTLTGAQWAIYDAFKVRMPGPCRGPGIGRPVLSGRA